MLEGWMDETSGAALAQTPGNFENLERAESIEILQDGTGAQHKLNMVAQTRPALGPKILFFSGGSALNGLSQSLQLHTHNSIHLVTPFDSGGSSAKLRAAFDMPAIGDIRNRLMALADQHSPGFGALRALFNYRLSNAAELGVLQEELAALAHAEHTLSAALAPHLKPLICDQLQHFLKAMPLAFDLRGASIGNLVLVGAYLKHHKNLDETLLLFSNLLGAKGVVRPIVYDDVHLAADLADGSQVLGQHLLTGKEVEPLSCAINRLSLSKSARHYQPAEVQLDPQNQGLIQSADLICYPPGSFYSSLIANLLPSGVGRAVASNSCAKVFIPNLGEDPEQVGMSLEQRVATLLQHLQCDFGGNCTRERLLDYVLIDHSMAEQLSESLRAELAEQCVQVLEKNLIGDAAKGYYHSDLLADALVRLANRSL